MNDILIYRIRFYLQVTNKVTICCFIHYIYILLPVWKDDVIITSLSNCRIIHLFVFVYYCNFVI
jgi:hypothetical protein